MSIIPKPGHESDVEKNPYIAYNCARIVRDGEVAVLTNGSQTDPIAQKIDAGMPVRDALALSLIALDYEHDSYNTPRICAVVDRTNQTGWLATVREDGLNVCRMPLSPRTFFYVATYEENDISEARCGAFDAETPQDACTFLLGGGIFAQRTNPVTAVAAVATDEAAKNVVTVKDMTAGTQSQHAIDTLAAHIKGALQKTPPEQPSGTSGA